jgi:hypothetical protein
VFGLGWEIIMFEKRFAAISLQPFIANGTSSGVITVVDASFFKVKQEVIVQANTLPNLDSIEVKEVISATQLRVGPKGTSIVGPASQIDLSLYTTALSAGIFSNEQKRPIIKEEEFNRAVYEEEPTVAIRSFLVDKLGRGYNDDNPLPVNASVSIGDITIGTDGFNLTEPDSMLATGSEDGTKTGVKHAFVNNVRNMVLATQNRQASFTYADFGTKNQRVTRVDYTSPIFPGITVRRDFAYTLVSNRYRRDNEIWSVV